uniref:Uncharacterized protein n=1 Tax=Zooxanthella nutricula TaxID=1333877 RepID=A0A7S2LSN5_9DINO
MLQTSPWPRPPAAEDAPGLYQVVADRIGVGPTANMGTIIAELEEGAVVHVLDVLWLRDEQRLRGRLLHPPGWISLRSTGGDDRRCWARRLDGSTIDSRDCGDLSDVSSEQSSWSSSEDVSLQGDVVQPCKVMDGKPTADYFGSLPELGAPDPIASLCRCCVARGEGAGGRSPRDGDAVGAERFGSANAALGSGRVAAAVESERGLVQPSLARRVRLSGRAHRRRPTRMRL